MRKRGLKSLVWQPILVAVSLLSVTGASGQAAAEVNHPKAQQNKAAQKRAKQIEKKNAKARKAAVRRARKESAAKRI